MSSVRERYGDTRFSEVARRYGIAERVLFRWKQELTQVTAVRGGRDRGWPRDGRERSELSGSTSAMVSRDIRQRTECCRSYDT
jgi:transposase-like protein